MLPTPNTSPQREVLVNRTNVTTEPFHVTHKLPTPPSHGLVKRSRPANDGGPRLKRLKFTIGGSNAGGEKEEEENGVDVDESEEDGGGTAALWNARRKRTIFHARNALAMSRPGVTCRPLPCKSSFYPWRRFVVDRQIAVPTRSLLSAYVSSHKTDVFACNSDRTDSLLAPPYACAYTNGTSSLFQCMNHVD
jgi:denticleless